ncbi:MAG: hypothetical protein Kow0074_11680 [Candidatus Zixiibacteriota bacterium]
MFGFSRLIAVPPRRSRRHWAQRSGYILFILALTLAASRASALDMTVTPGIGHDQFTETFYIDDTSSVSIDSLERIRRTENALLESYGSIGLGLAVDRWQLESTVYGTDAVWRNISSLRGRVQSGRWTASVNSRLEWKDIDRDDPLASAYTFIRTDIKPEYRIDDHWRVNVRGDWEIADYRRESAYTVDYTRFRAETGLQYFGHLLESIDLRAGVSVRDVPDSMLMNYSEFYLRSDAFGWYVGNWRVAGSMSFAARRYDDDPDGNDHRRYFLELRTDYDWSAFWRVYGTVNWQRWDYTDVSAILYDLDDWRALASARAVLAEKWELGGTMEFRLENPLGDAGDGNGYVQWGAGPVIEWQPSLTFWAELSNQIGYRDYETGSLIYDDYSFWELAVRADIYLPSGPNAQVAVSYLRESHDDPLRDHDQLYLSASLRYPLAF